MLEKVYSFSTSDDKSIKKLINDEPLLINHMVLPKDQGLPEHYSDSNLYMIVVRGTITIKLDEQEPHQHKHGQIINIPYHTKMNIINLDDDILEFFVIKSPNPKNYGGNK